MSRVSPAIVAPTPIGACTKVRAPLKPLNKSIFVCVRIFTPCRVEGGMSGAKPPSKEISPKLRKTIDRLQTRIKDSADYEVHQELKAVASRHAFSLCSS